MDNLGSNLPRFHLQLKTFAFILILYFSTDVNFQTTLNLFWFIILHTLYCGVFLNHLHFVNPVPPIRSFFHFSFMSWLMEQCNVLSF